MSDTLPPHLRELLAVMERDMGVSRDALLAQAVFTLARLHGYVVPSELPAPPRAAAETVEPSEAAPASPRMEPVAPALEDDDRPDVGPELPSESTIVRRSNQAVRIRAIADDVARLTVPFEPSRPQEESPEAADDDEWLDDADEAADDAWSSAGFAEEEDGFYAEDEPPVVPEATATPERAASEHSAALASEHRDHAPVPEEERDPFDIAAESGSSWDDLDELRPAESQTAAPTERPGAEPSGAEPSGAELSGAELFADGAAEEPVVPEPSLPELVGPSIGDPLLVQTSADLSVDEPAWVETSTPEASLGPHPAIGDPTEVDESRDVGPLLGSKRGSEGDYKQLLADLEDLESGVASMPLDDELGSATDVVEARSRLTLTVEGTDESVEVGSTPFVIGRTQDCDLQIISERVSRQHAVIESEGPFGYRIIDRNSSNGLWLGRERIKEHTLRDGDVLRVGDKRVRASITLSTDR